MDKQYEIKFIARKDILTIIPYLKMLDSHIDKVTLKERLNEMLNYGYQCAGLYFQGMLIGVSGVWTLYKYYIGKHLEVDNVIIHPDYRSRGLGKKLMDWIMDYGKSIGCVATELNSYITNDRGNQFWEEYGCEKLGYHFRKTY
ncbi:MAG: GNAT family N-acetyltransferase [Flavobacteriales bacterium]|nr:MAG: GNAT family N-acetyltransferase [Flavobacteriales bacterium]